MPFGQVVIGPPGSGKTVYCHGMQQFLTGLGRKVAVINLDPANDFLPYECAVNISELVNVNAVMMQTDLGPNGGLLYCMEFIEKNLDWLEEKLKPYQDHYLLFDFPGQVELYTHHKSVNNILEILSKGSYRLTVVHLVDSYYCRSASNYVSVLLLSLMSMVKIELPHVNILSKVDLVEQHGKLDFNLDFYTDVMDLSYLEQYLAKDTSPKFQQMNKAICELIEDFNLVSFLTLNIQDKHSVYEVVKVIDKSNGYVFGGLQSSNESIMMCAQGETNWDYYRVADVQEKYMDDAVSSDNDDGQ